MKNKTALLTIFLLLMGSLIVVNNVVAQQVENIDTAFQEARELAFEGNREQARELAYRILDQSPNYHDVRILIARTYSWDEQYTDARRELNYVLDKVPDHKDALSALVDTNIWAEQPNQAVEVAITATRFYPTDEELNLKKAQAYIANDDEREAQNALDAVDAINPSSTPSRELRRSLIISGQRYTFTAAHTQDWFSDVFDPAAKSYVQLGRRTRYGSVIGRVNYSNRFDTKGIQPEIDFYPSLIDGWYGYLNAGFTTSSIYPQFRFGAELYKNLSNGFEASAGIRYLNFESGSVIIYTGSMSKYWRSWYFSARPFFTPSSVGISQSLNLTARHYFNGPRNYITLTGGFGFSPEERRFQDVSGNVFFVKSQYVGLNIFKALRYNTAIFGGIDISNQELSFDPDRYIQIYTFNIGIQHTF